MSDMEDIYELSKPALGLLPGTRFIRQASNPGCLTYYKPDIDDESLVVGLSISIREWEMKDLIKRGWFSKETCHEKADSRWNYCPKCGEKL